MSVCLLQAVLVTHLVFQLSKLSNGFKKLSGEGEENGIENING